MATNEITVNILNQIERLQHRCRETVSIILYIRKNKDEILDILKQNLQIYIDSDFKDNIERFFNNDKTFIEVEQMLNELYQIFSKEKNISDIYTNLAYRELKDCFETTYSTNYLSVLPQLAINQLKDHNDVTRIANNVFHMINREEPMGVDTLHSRISLLRLMAKFKSIEKNIVMIGPNGSGKSTLSRKLKELFEHNITVIPAQKLFDYHSITQVPINSKYLDDFHNYQSEDKLCQDDGYVEFLKNDFHYLIRTLICEYNAKASEYYEGNEREDAIIRKTVSIWNELISHRNLDYSVGEIIAKNNENQYAFRYLSDGEKATFYYISYVLLAQEKSYIIIDEPENHLNLSIICKLWDTLEKERKDCKFIYLTHNLDFASSRQNVVKLWNKSFTPPYNWDFEILPEDEEIPKKLIMELVGSRQSILFCESKDKSGLDYRLYSVLFPSITIVPADGHVNVINYCKAYNRKKHIFRQTSIGIIDGDCHLESEKKAWEKDRIFCINANEVENILCDENLLKKAIDQFKANVSELDATKNLLLDELYKNKDKQASWYATNMVNNQLKRNYANQKRPLDEIIEVIKKIADEDRIKEWYESRIQEIEKINKERDYEKAVRMYNLKGIIGLTTHNIERDYENRIFRLLSDDSDLRQYLISKYFPFMVKLN
jgi:energy-coupling factor transporter ATP-binding protein EcfA2